MWVAFACKSYSHFCSKNINIFENTYLATAVNKFIIKELIELMMLWRTGPRWCVEKLLPACFYEQLDWGYNVCSGISILIYRVVFSRYSDTLSLKVPITTAADDIWIFYIFFSEKGLTFKKKNACQAEGSHEMPSLFFSKCRLSALSYHNAGSLWLLTSYYCISSTLTIRAKSLKKY